MSLDWRKQGQSEEKVGYKWVTTKTFQVPDGQIGDFTTWHRPGSQNVTTIALTTDNKVVVARQFRVGPERVLDELPGGDANSGEDLASAAARELQEETGYATDEPLVLLGTAYRDAYSNELDNYFLARNCQKKSEQKLDEGEFIEITLISIAQLIENAKTGRMSDGVAVLMALDFLAPQKETA